MKKLVFGIAFVLVALVVAVLVAPNFVHWNQYRDQIASEAKSRTGRDIEINGDIRITLLPAPTLMVSDVHLANVEGSSDADMISLDALEIKIALAPLLGGNVRVQSIKLVKPVINLELLDGRRNNMVFEFSGPRSEKPKKNEDPVSDPSSVVPLSVTISEPAWPAIEKVPKNPADRRCACICHNRLLKPLSVTPGEVVFSSSTRV